MAGHGYHQGRAILADPRVSANSRLEGYPQASAGAAARHRVTQNFINMDNPEHDRQRRMLTRDFMVKRMQAMRPTIQALVDSLIDEMLAGPSPVDLVEVLALPVPSLVICDMMDVSYDDRGLFHELSRTMVSRRSTPRASGRSAQRDARVHEPPRGREGGSPRGRPHQQARHDAAAAAGTSPASRSCRCASFCWSPGTRPPAT